MKIPDVAGRIKNICKRCFQKEVTECSKKQQIFKRERKNLAPSGNLP